MGALWVLCGCYGCSNGTLLVLYSVGSNALQSNALLYSTTFSGNEHVMKYFFSSINAVTITEI